jgi:EAL domain-containing protein (putative c-di-GMP-specific phosphodiesterase class I)
MVTCHPGRVRGLDGGPPLSVLFPCKLKIDQSFVSGVTEDPEDQGIVCAIINLANSLGLHTTAEGVETAEQLAFLRAQGCNEAQGYYFSKPLPADRFAALVREKATRASWLQ